MELQQLVPQGGHAAAAVVIVFVVDDVVVSKAAMSSVIDYRVLKVRLQGILACDYCYFDNRTCLANRTNCPVTKALGTFFNNYPNCMLHIWA